MPKPAPRSKAGTSTSTQQEPRRKAASFPCCCCSIDTIDMVVNEAQMTSRALTAAPPIDLQPGYANEDGASRAIAPPTSGVVEVVNKSKHAGEIIAVIVSSNAAQLALKRSRDVQGHLQCVSIMPAQTVVNGRFGDDVDTLEIALFYGCSTDSVDKLSSGSSPENNFHHIKGYRVECRGRNVMLKYKDGVGLECQKGESGFVGGLVGKAKRSLGGGIDMKTNVSALELIGSSAAA